jgi:MFS family permease
LVILLFFVMWVSFFDRGNLAVAAPVLAPELGNSPYALGWPLSGFFWTYAAGQLGAAWLVDRIEIR